MTSAYTHIVFDLDGTLIDSATQVELLINELRREVNLPNISRDVLIPYISKGGPELISNLLKVKDDAASHWTHEFRKRYLRVVTPTDCLYPGVTNVLQTLKEKGFHLSICTNKPRRLATKVLQETGIADFFSKVCAGDDLDTRKPDPRTLNACLARHDGERRVIVVGDSTIDATLAKNAGVAFGFFAGGYNDGVDVASVSFSFDSYVDFSMEWLGV